ncbi:hypothetical protein D3C78_1801270 [compost metagenome]
MIEAVDDDAYVGDVQPQAAVGVEARHHVHGAAVEFAGSQHVRLQGGEGDIGSKHDHFQHGRARALGVDQHQIVLVSESWHQIGESQPSVGSLE